MNDANRAEWEVLRHQLETVLMVTSERRRGFTANTPRGDEIIVERATGDASEWLVVRARICARPDMDPEASLERNDALAFAAIVLGAGTYWLRVAFPFGALELRDPVRLVYLCVEAARSLAPTRVQPAADAYRLFSYYAD
jgi:hypothetical protein